MPPCPGDAGMIERIYKKPEPTPSRPARKPSRRFLVVVAIVVVLLAIPTVVIVLTNMEDIQIPEAKEGCITIVRVRGRSPVGTLSAEGINHLRAMIERCEPVKNPLTIVRTYFRYRDLTKRDSEVWVEVMFPVEGDKSKIDIYLILQDGNIAHISSPEGTQTLHAPFTAAELHAELSERTARPARDR